MDFGIEFDDELIEKTTCLSITQMIFTIVVWSTMFTESVILDFIKVFIFFFGMCGACIIGIYNTNAEDRQKQTRLKMLPCGMMVMISFSLIIILIILLKIISKGMMDCWGEFIALFFAGALCLCWVAVMTATDRHIEDEGIHEPNGSGQQVAVRRIEAPDEGAVNTAELDNADARYAARL